MLNWLKQGKVQDVYTSQMMFLTQLSIFRKKFDSYMPVIFYDCLFQMLDLERETKKKHFSRI